MTTDPYRTEGPEADYRRDYKVTGYNAEGESLSLRPEHQTDFQAYLSEAHEAGPYTAGEALAYVAEAGRKGMRTNDDYAHIIEPVHHYHLWYSNNGRATGHFEVYPAPKTSAHSVCTHANTKAARAACRRAAR